MFLQWLNISNLLSSSNINARLVAINGFPAAYLKILLFAFCFANNYETNPVFRKFLTNPRQNFRVLISSYISDILHSCPPGNR